MTSCKEGVGGLAKCDTIAEDVEHKSVTEGRGVNIV